VGGVPYRENQGGADFEISTMSAAVALPMATAGFVWRHYSDCIVD